MVDLDTLNAYNYTHMTLVGVTFFGINSTILNDVLECINHQATTTAIITLFSYSKNKMMRHIEFVIGNILVREQSMRFCSERETSFPVALKCCPSRDPVVLKAQQEPH